MRSFFLFSLLTVSFTLAYDNVKMLCLVNSQRAKNGLHPLGLDEKLTKAAQLHSEDQAKIKKMSHDGSDGSTVGQRITRVGFKWTSIAENVAYNCGDEQGCMDVWMNSQGHRENILSNSVTMFGSGEADASNGYTYFTQDFASDGSSAKNIPDCSMYGTSPSPPSSSPVPTPAPAPAPGRTPRSPRTPPPPPPPPPPPRKSKGKKVNTRVDNPKTKMILSADASSTTEDGNVVSKDEKDVQIPDSEGGGDSSKDENDVQIPDSENGGGGVSDGGNDDTGNDGDTTPIDTPTRRGEKWHWSLSSDGYVKVWGYVPKEFLTLLKKFQNDL